MKKIIFVFTLVFAVAILNAQSTSGKIPDGSIDSLVDNIGNKYALQDLLINPIGNSGPKNSPNQIAATSVSCTAGYFRLFFAAGSGFDGNTSPDTDRRNVLCQLFTDLSCLIVSPLSSSCNTTTNITTFVNIHITNSSSSSLGSAAPLFAAPGNAAVGATLVDCMAHKTIVSGVDAYTNVLTPILTTGSNNFYHMLMKFNTGYNWYYNLSPTPPINVGQNDFYTVALHEALHGLGFMSLMNQSGNSLYSPLQNIYSRYDKNLRTNNFTPVLSPTNTPCANTNLQYTLNPNAVNPGNCVSSGTSDNTNPSTMCYYVSSSTSMTVPVYTPNCFEMGSSWSHFEDQHYPTPAAGNNNYFVMSNVYGGPNSGMKRHPREEEKIVLCDLGYSVAGSYVSPVTGAPFTYTSGACSGPGIWGVNDGLSNNSIIYNAVLGTVSIPTTSIKANDSPSTSQLDCISFVYNYPGINLSVTGGSITVSYAPGPILYCGVVLLQYIPKTASGIPGNVTYIYTYFPCGSCNPPNLCDHVQNGGFENLINPAFCAGVMTPTDKPHCWDVYTNTPDIFTGNPSCSTSNYYFPGSFPSQLMLNNTYNGAPNYNTIGLTMTSGNTVTSTWEESIKTDLSAPLVPTQTYVLSFWAFNSKSIYNAQSLPHVITFATRVNFSALAGSGYPSTFDNVIANFTLMPSDFNTWKQYTTTVVFNASQNHKCLVVGMNPLATTAMNNNTSTNQYYTLIDDVSLLDMNNALLFSPPQTLCNNTSLSQLSQYCNQPTALFSGPFVTLNNGDYDFNPTAPGNYTILASYTNNVGCSYTTQAVIVVPGLSITPSSTLFCNYLNYTLSAVASPTNITLPIPNWQPANINAQSIQVSGNNPGPHIVTSNYMGCPLFAMFTPTIVPNTIITSTPSIWCATPNAAYSMSLSVPNFTPSSFTQTWSPPISSNANPVSVTYNNITNPVYSATTTVSGCTNIATYTATWVSSSIAIVNGTNCIPANQNATLQAVPSTTLPTTYTWQPGNLNTPQIIISPTVPTTYTLYSSTGNCTLTNTITMYTAPQFTNLPTSICSGQPLYYLQNFLAPGTPTIGTFSGPGTSTTNVGGQILTALNVPVSTAPGVYTYTYSYLTPAGCFATNTFTLNILQGFVLSVNTQQSYYCANLNLGLLLGAQALPSANVTYTWLPISVVSASTTVYPSSNTIYTVVASNGSCTFTNEIRVITSNSCCSSQSYIATPVVTSQTFVGLYAINQDIIIQGSVTFAGEFLVAPGVNITVAPGATLSSGQYTPGAVGSALHMLACTEMWQGINVQNGGKIIFRYGDLIEDAKEAVVSDGCTTTNGIDVEMIGVAFNKNDKSIIIRNYNQATNSTPFEISNCVFTCRNFNFPLYQLTGWPTAQVLYTPSGPMNTLATPYLVGSYAQAFLKAPMSTMPSMAGVWIENSGITLNPTGNPTYYTIPVNFEHPYTSGNLFDKLVIGIAAKNSNVTSFNNVFQNTRRYNLTPTILTGGYGIYAWNDNTGSNKNNRLNTVNSFSPSVLVNTFYDCHFGIFGSNLYELNCQYQDFRSKQSSSTPFNNGLSGQFGISSIGNRFKSYIIRYNNIQNIRTGVNLSMITGPLSLPSIPSSGVYMGKITISNNLFSPTMGTVSAVGTGFINIGVTLDGLLGASTPTNTFYETGASAKIIDNYFSRVFRAIQVSAFSNATYNAFSATNLITMISDPVASGSQYGIYHRSNISDVINTNTITGTAGTLSDTRVVGIYKSTSSNGSIQCNILKSLNVAFQFAGNNQGTFWRYNTMNAHKVGLKLTNNYLIGPQGSVNSPSDNQWLGSWTGVNGTWTDGSNATSLSPLVVRNSPTAYYPPNNGGTLPYGSAGTIINANNNAPVSPCVPVPAGGGGGGGGNRVALFNNIVNDKIEYLINKDAAQEIYKAIVFRDISIDPSLKDSSSTLAEFYFKNSFETLGSFNMVETNINQGNLNAAENILASPGIKTAIENNHKIFYSTYINYLKNGSLNEQDRSVLFTLSNQCPFIGGPIIYQARSLYSIVAERVDFYNDNDCKASVVNSMSKNEFSDRKIYDIYPNPAAGEFNIISNVKNEKLNVNVYDVNGKLVLQNSVTTTNYTSAVPVNMLNGIYFVNIINSNGDRIIKKLIIARD